MGSFLRLSVLLLIFSLASTSDNTKLSAYEVLELYNFLIGLLPKGCMGYDLDADSGEFSTYFNSTCSFSLEGSYQLRYQPTISGRISNSQLSDLTASASRPSSSGSTSSRSLATATSSSSPLASPRPISPSTTSSSAPNVVAASTSSPPLRELPLPLLLLLLLLPPSPLRIKLKGAWSWPF